MKKREPREHGRGSSAAIWWPLIALACCGGTALLLLVGGAGLAGTGIIGASAWLLVTGIIVVGIALAWRRTVRRH